MLQEAGFVNVELVRETGFNASPKTKGVLVRAAKTEILEACKREQKQTKTKIETRQKFGNTKSGSG